MNLKTKLSIILNRDPPIKENGTKEIEEFQMTNESVSIHSYLYRTGFFYLFNHFLNYFYFYGRSIYFMLDILFFLFIVGEAKLYDLQNCWDENQSHD